jgi:hypothetical protein
MKYNVKISCFGHTFNIKGVEAVNSDDAGIKALVVVRKSLLIASVQPVKTRDDDVEDLMGFFGMKR